MPHGDKSWGMSADPVPEAAFGGALAGSVASVAGLSGSEDAAGLEAAAVGGAGVGSVTLDVDGACEVGLGEVGLGGAGIDGAGIGAVGAETGPEGAGA